MTTCEDHEYVGTEKEKSPTHKHSPSDGLSLKKKTSRIKKVLSSDNVDPAKLKEFAISRGGLLNDEIRKQAWPKLLNVNVNDIPKKPDAEVLKGHRDYNQVVLDVNRTLKRFPPAESGYHDICVTFLLVVGEDLAFALVDTLSLNHLRDFMDSNMDRTKHMLNYLYPIIGKSNPDLREFLECSEVGTVFCLSWLITWYGHVLNDLRHIVRLYDFFIACHPLMPIYLAAAIVLYREEEILSNECEMCVLHGLLSKIPDNLPFEQLISKAGDLFLQYPPPDLANEAVLTFRKKSEAIAKYQQAKVKRDQQLKRNSLISSFYIQDGSNIFYKVTVWTLTAVVSAAVITLLNSARQWY
ncbi:hypothetical protein KUTeg_019859 [Tegillarca granosa]|uniref:Rab-GAP TBC domain-containing protein n=1 Tax=Tegillarca granosa TaxID=220873 RepID=A0ABQ9EJQ5_TEGGR|nr:hypothetical protein KUTeg_019859 [Tegillarca granosa]